jgi:hypothetical protein
MDSLLHPTILLDVYDFKASESIKRGALRKFVLHERLLRHKAGCEASIEMA